MLKNPVASPAIRSLRKRFVIIGAAGLLAGCTAFDPLNQTGEEINRNATDYANDAELLNVVRASLSEPLTFITITGLDGTDTASGTIGLPGVTFGPHAAASPHTFAFGPNSAGRSNSNTFHVSVVDDPASFTALLAPLNPAMLGFFLRQGYTNDVLFFLFVDRIRRVEKNNSGNVTKVDRDWFNDPSDKKRFGEFINEMANLLAAGLTAEVDVTTIPTGRSLPSSKLCIDPNTPLPNFAELDPPGVMKLREDEQSDACEGASWVATQSADGSGGGSSAGAPSRGGVASGTMVVGSDNSLWVSLDSQNKIVRITHDASGKLAISDPVELPKDSKAVPKTHPEVAYSLDSVATDENGKKTAVHYQVFMRSTYGIYDYIGALLNNGTDIDSFRPDGSGYRGLVDVIPPRDENSSRATCFAQAEYRGKNYCVPNDSNRTKQVFALLHQLQELSTAPSNAPTTLTVTTVP